MDSTRPSNPKTVLTLNEAAQILAVSVDVLLTWNEYNILKPTITTTGEIGYFQEQIDQFITIQKSTQLVNANSPLSPSPVINPHTGQIKAEKPFTNFRNETNNNFSQVNNYNFFAPTHQTFEKNKITLSTIGILGAFSFFIITVSVILLSQQNKINDLLYQNQISNLKGNNVVSANNNTTTVQTSNINNQSGKKNKLNNEGDIISQNKFASLSTIFEKDKKSNSTSRSGEYKNQIALIESVVGKNDGIINNSDSQSKTDTRSYSQKSNFAKSSSCPTCSKDSDTDNTVFDTEGNIKVSKNDDLENKLLATTLGVEGINQNQYTNRQSTNSIILFAFLGLGLMFMYVTYGTRKHTSLSPANLDISGLQAVNYPQEIEIQKVLEVDQKTDGTVVFYLQGKEYKISKPELDSESDKFIERIMELVGPGIKEIEYDALQDDKLILSAPLSKIVTRLGFVGIKRDLFFPRTSKSRVLFRKYITQNDLISMNLTVDQILNEFIINY